MRLKIAKWFENYQSASVFMIDDLSDSYIARYKEELYKNDWGYLCDKEDSSFSFLNKELLSYFPKIKITYFVPYLKHNVINDNSEWKLEKYDVGEREEFTVFLNKLQDMGHEISHHGSTHGEYIDKSNPSSNKNFKHEWELYTDVTNGVEVTVKGVEVFKNININVSGGKFCGYRMIDNSLEIIDNCNFEYWCTKAFNPATYDVKTFGRNNVIDFPTTFSGNSFVRLSYLTGNPKKDKMKKYTQFLQPFYNLLKYKELNNLYKNGHIISVQEHTSPTKSSIDIQSTNIVSDIKSLKKIYKFLSKKSIWYATCHEISRYIYTRENTKLVEDENMVQVILNNYKKFDNLIISLNSSEDISLWSKGTEYKAKKNNNSYVLNLPISDGTNTFTFRKNKEV